MRVLVGLGNPGPRYAKNRHNIGFMAVDALARRHGFAAFRNRFESDCAEGRLEGTPILALKPQTFMNESGRAASAVARFFKLEAKAFVVIHDEIDLAAGKVKVKRGGGHAGHNGLRSLDRHIGSDYLRVRIGVGHPGDRHRVRDHVLEDFGRDDMAWIAPLLDALAEAAPLLLDPDDGGRFMTRLALLRDTSAPERDLP